MNDLLATLLSVVLSGVLATFITIFYQKHESDSISKRTLFQTAVSYRFYISDEENVKALNSIDVVFHKYPTVRLTWRSFMEEADKQSVNGENLRDKYIKLLEEMAVACGYKNIKWDDLKKYYFPDGLSKKKFDDEVLRKLQIQAAEKSISEATPEKNVTSKQQISNEQALSLLPKILENPDAFVKLMQATEKKK